MRGSGPTTVSKDRAVKSTTDEATTSEASTKVPGSSERMCINVVRSKVGDCSGPHQMESIRSQRVVRGHNFRHDIEREVASSFLKSDR